MIKIKKKKLNLKKCENTLIGVAKLGIKGISGGESRSNLLEYFNFKINHLNSNVSLLLLIYKKDLHLHPR